jgi:superfamily II RNA helicase
VSNESGIAVVEDEYVQSFKVEMMDAVLQWCKGAKFADICKVGLRRIGAIGDVADLALAHGCL